jgi:hypothetical protein
MTSALGVEHVVRRKRRFHLHCACGATIVTNERTATCTDCGETISFHRGRQLRQHWNPRPHKQVAQELVLILGGLLLSVVILYLFGLGWAIFAFVVAACAFGTGTRQRTGHHPEISDHAKGYRYLGLASLLFAAFLAFAPIIASDAFQERLAVLNAPKPSDCDWTLTPLGDKHCHYESSVSHLSDRHGEHINVEWHRVDD